MKARLVPERVHVVRPPEDHSIEIVRALAQISDRLKRSEAERGELLAELREYRKALAELEDKTEQGEKAYLALENKLKVREKNESDTTQRQIRFEKALKDTEDRLVKTVAGQALLDQRIADTESKSTAINQRLDESAAVQIRIDRQLEKVSQDKVRMLRKVERLEEVVAETKDALQSKAMVLLTDQSVAAQRALPSTQGWSMNDSAFPGPSSVEKAPWWRPQIRMQTSGTIAMVVAALLIGWMINQAQQPEIPKIAVLENGGLAQLNLDENRWDPIVRDNREVTAEPLDTGEAAAAKAPEERTPDEQAAYDALQDEMMTPPVKISGISPQDTETAAPAPTEAVITPEPEAAVPVEEQAVVPETSAQKAQAIDYTDDQSLLAALEQDPEGLAARLNEIEPEKVTPASEEIVLPADIVPPLEDLVDTAFKQDPKLATTIAAERPNMALTERAKPDQSLPNVIGKIESKAFEGSGEAQHDLAAIYTSGHGGVRQDFGKAAFWFREASENGIANARYNLGVLYHQGLGVDRDLGRALYWYREAAKIGHPEAQYNLGIAYIEGIGTDYDPRLAAAFFERSASEGIMEAAYNLGLIHENGLLGQPRPEEALYWYKKAADKGSEDAKAALIQLSETLQVGPEDVEKMAARRDAIREAASASRNKGRVNN